jgi:ubiquinone/menaquinone biosynthesis C-methylase UbiE
MTTFRSVGRGELEWDYTELAAAYDMRADYAAHTVAEIVRRTSLVSNSCVADVGAGTGKLTKQLVAAGLTVDAVEPNAAMLRCGIANLERTSVRWFQATAENTSLATSSYDLVTFGSSFNVVNTTAALQEATRILKSNGDVAIIWNHRDLSSPSQANIENVIRRSLPNFDYGDRRADPSPLVRAISSFRPFDAFELHHVHATTREAWLRAWHSHATWFYR